jgi:hypothetical protein
MLIKTGNNNAPDANSSPDGTASLNFDFPLDFTTKLDTFNALVPYKLQSYCNSIVLHE